MRVCRAAQFLNNYFLLFYIAFFREGLNSSTADVGAAASTKNQCAGSSCLPELQSQLMIVFTGKTVAKQVAHTLKPFVTKWVNSCKQMSSLSKLKEQAQHMAEQAQEQAMHMAEQASSMVGDMINDDHDEDDNEEEEVVQGPDVLSRIEYEAGLMGYEGTFDDFNDRVVQFGYLVLFAPAYPLAPFLAFINNVLEIRFGGYKMCNGFQRPVWKQRRTIGSWLGMLNILGFAAVVTNAAMVCFVGSETAQLKGLNYDIDLENHIVTTITDIIKPEGTFLGRLNHADLWWRFVIMEHLVMLARVAIISISPTVPEWVINGRQTLSYRRKEVYLTNAQLYQKSEGIRRYNLKLAGKKLSSGKHKVRGLAAMGVLGFAVEQGETGFERGETEFERADTNKDGVLSRQEFKAASG